MLNFFRRFRRNQLTNNKISRYLLYAAGEIALVMIGILLALQVNNWNLRKSKAADEAYILSEILDNLQEDSEQLKYIESRRAKTETGVLNMLESFENDSPDNPIDEDDFAAFLTFERYYPISNAYEMLKSIGVKIQNKTLRSAISRYYDFEQERVSQSVADIEREFIRLMQTDNDIRKNIKRAATGTQANAQLELLDPTNSTFKQGVFEELIIFRDNNSATLEKLREFILINEQLIKYISRELKESRLSKHLSK